MGNLIFGIAAYARVVDNPSSKPIGDSVMGFSDRVISFLLLDRG